MQLIKLSLSRGGVPEVGMANPEIRTRENEVYLTYSEARDLATALLEFAAKARQADEATR